ncbi:hypothetical protein Tasa_051_016 [Tanticharoenia sakaeratensis NBRC 103193]|uniref:Uncharacterized protein n=1 Tax=Tanticharoenia sakaeratensis NBRC 103193 TaxID=1231623 RepID=A0A0D6MQ78_9PROT|nr:hypothetical protein Tasa_051_016 [Tanticharoenia sakaeratensis NBRC 103193]GBQ22844.1 hypothetical protein AA103193_2205 [Tanticharoenia sakaeratensis NBRC 103193]
MARPRVLPAPRGGKGVGQSQTGPLTAFGLTILAIAGDAMAAGILPPGTQVPVHFGASMTPD